jgi:RimJ/RimL family protein N-acetyltransferase
MIEELQTERLILRGWSLADFEVLAEFLTDDELCKHRGGAISRIEASDFMSKEIGQWSLRGYGGYAIEERSLNRVIGFTGLWHPHDFDEPELYWSIFQGFHGKGYATEAASAVRDWAIEVKGVSIMSFVSVENKPSIRVAERLGATRDKDTMLQGVQKRVYRHQLHQK